MGKGIQCHAVKDKFAPEFALQGYHRVNVMLQSV